MEKGEKDKVNPVRIIEFFSELARLKDICRRGWLQRGVSEIECESVAEHSFGVALLGYVVASECRPDLDTAKVMAMGLLHDIGEIRVGDITPKDGISSEEKEKREKEAVKGIFAGFSSPEKYVALHEEYENQSTPEAVFVKQADKLEMALQARLYGEEGHGRMEEFIKYAKERIGLPELAEIIKEIEKGI